MKLADAGPEHFEILPRVDSRAVTIRWIEDYYDGPLSGMALVDGRTVRFEIVDRGAAIGGDGERRFWLVELTPRQVLEAEMWQDLFCEHVGTHWDYTERPRNARPQSEHWRFYEPYSRRVPPDYRANDVLGWCVEVSRPRGAPGGDRR